MFDIKQLESPDFPILISYLRKDGMTVQQIANYCGCHHTYITKIQGESSGLSDFPLKLIRCFLENTERDIPQIGEYHEVIEDYDIIRRNRK